MASKADQFKADSAAPPTVRKRSRADRIAESIGSAPPGPPPTKAPTNKLVHWPRNPRRNLPKVADMAESLLEQDQTEPLLVVTRAAYLAVVPEDEPAIAEQEEENGERALAVVIDGNRRLAGARQAGTEEMAITINDAMATSAAALLEKALTTTLHKEQLTPLDEARALAELVEVHGSHRAVAQRIGRSHVYVGQRLALLNLSPELQAQVDSGELPLEDARQAARAAEEDQQRAADAAQQKREKRNAGRRSPGPADAPPSGNGATTPADEERPDVEAELPPARTESPETSTEEPAQEQQEPDERDRDEATKPAVGPADAPPSGNGATTVALNWDDLPALAAIVRQHLNHAQRQTLVSLISTD